MTNDERESVCVRLGLGSLAELNVVLYAEAITRYAAENDRTAVLAAGNRDDGNYARMRALRLLGRACRAEGCNCGVPVEGGNGFCATGDEAAHDAYWASLFPDSHMTVEGYREERRKARREKEDTWL